MDNFKEKRESEKQVVGVMIDVYCRKNHKSLNGLCSECRELLDYTNMRTDKCPHMEDKTFCSSCETHCYDAKHRDRIKEVMKFSGPRMIFHHPIIMIKHLLDSNNLSIKNIVFLLLGLLFMGIGGIGVVLPILPTTPFLLLASYFFMEGSPKFNRWYKNTKLYKKHLESFEKDRSMTLKTKVCILAFASIMLAIPLIKVDVLPMRIFIVFLYIFKYYYFIFKIKTIAPQKAEY